MPSRMIINWFSLYFGWIGLTKELFTIKSLTLGSVVGAYFKVIPWPRIPGTNQDNHDTSDPHVDIQGRPGANFLSDCALNFEATKNLIKRSLCSSSLSFSMLQEWKYWEKFLHTGKLWHQRKRLDTSSLAQTVLGRNKHGASYQPHLHLPKAVWTLKLRHKSQATQKCSSQ